MTAVVPRLDVEQPLTRMLEALDCRHFRHARAFERYRRSGAWMIGFHWCDSYRAHGSGAGECDRLVKIDRGPRRESAGLVYLHRNFGLISGTSAWFMPPRSAVAS